MATLLLQAAGTAIGGFLGGPIGGAIGSALGAAAGSLIDASLLGAVTAKSTRGPRLNTLGGITSTEGAPVPRVYGRARIGGQMIWATRFQEVAQKSRAKGAAGKGGGGTSVTNYSYYANFAVGLCEGPIASVRRVWADGKELDLTLISMRVYHGDEAQMPDPLIVAKEGQGNAPAYRGLAYVVFERLLLTKFGNRAPQLTFEVVRPVAGLASMIRGVDIIPGASEFAYAPKAFTSQLAPGVSRSENRHQLTHASDWLASIDALQELCPNLTSVALVVAWFGNDLRAGQCKITPRVEVNSKTVLGGDWQVAGLARSTALAVSLVNGVPAYGGTPTDAAVVAAIQDLRARGLKVVFYPFVMMDVPGSNALPDPWTGNAGQPAYPWRGRITCEPAPGRAGSPDGTAAAGAQVAGFFGSSAPGAGEWSFRRFILYYAALCATAGGVDAFLVGSEMAALTRVRSGSGLYPAAVALAQLASDVKAIAGAGTKVSYAADWTEYGAHVLAGGAEVRFPLDVVWGAAAVDFVGLDVYWPLSDWRDGASHLDLAEAASVYDRAYLARRVSAGEGFDFYYADAAARLAQARTPIADGAYGKPWVFRQKDLVGWWSNRHFERVGGVELASPTAWLAKSKPIWLVETGCPAVDRGANAPNVFPDPKSSESALPYFSRGGRDDLIQMRALEAVLTHFDPVQPGYVAGSNPVSPVYGGLMVDPARTHVWAWDARPFPAFPDQTAVWADVGNWDTGHWLNGRLEGVQLDRLVQELLSDVPGRVSSVALSPIEGFLDGYVVDKVMSARGAIEPLSALFGFDALVQAGSVRLAGRSGRAVMTLGDGDLVPNKEGKLLHLSRSEETQLPRELAVTFGDSERAYRSATALSRRLAGYSKREAQAELAVMMRRAEVQRLADVWLQDLWVARETADFALRPHLTQLEISDVVTLNVAGAAQLFRIERITDGTARSVSARAVEPAVYDRQAARLARLSVPSPRIPGPARVLVLDLAIARAEPAVLQYLALASDPWPGSLAVWRAAATGTYDLLSLAPWPALIGDTLNVLPPAPAGRWDRATVLQLRLNTGALASVSDIEVLAGKNAMAILGADGNWEICGFGRAELIAERTYALSRLIRGLGGDETLAARAVPAGAPVVLLDDALVALASGLSGLGLTQAYRAGPADRDIADPLMVPFSAQATAKALAPYAPVRAKARRGSGGVMISFVRRGRRDADAWEPVDIPLGEDREAYEIEIRRAGVVKRVLATSSPQALYASADEISDFGQAQTLLDLRVYQLSATVGRGFPLVAIVAIA